MDTSPTSLAHALTASVDARLADLRSREAALTDREAAVAAREAAAAAREAVAAAAEASLEAARATTEAHLRSARKAAAELAASRHVAAAAAAAAPPSSRRLEGLAPSPRHWRGAWRKPRATAHHRRLRHHPRPRDADSGGEDGHTLYDELSAAAAGLAADVAAREAREA